MENDISVFFFPFYPKERKEEELVGARRRKGKVDWMVPRVGAV